RLRDLPALGSRVWVVEAPVGVLECRLDFELEGVALELHANDALVDADVGVRVTRLQVVPGALEHSARPRVAVVIGPYLGREDKDHVEVGHALNGGVSPV